MFKYAKSLLLISLLLSLSLNCLADLPADFNNMGPYKELRVTDISGNKIILKDAKIGEGVILTDNTSTDFKQIIKLESKLGDNRVFGSVLGTLTGSFLGLSAFYVIPFYADKTTYAGDAVLPYWPIYASGIGGGVIGYLLGKNIPIFTPLYKEKNETGLLSPLLGLNFGWSGESKNRSAYAGIRYRF